MSMRYLLLLIPLSLMGCSMAMVRPMAEKQTADIGDSKLEYVMAGEGNPVIVFLSGYGADIDTSWSRIFPEVKTINTVLANNRFNYGDSDKVDVQQTGAEIIVSLESPQRKRVESALCFGGAFAWWSIYTTLCAVARGRSIRCCSSRFISSGSGGYEASPGRRYSPCGKRHYQLDRFHDSPKTTYGIHVIC